MKFSFIIPVYNRPDEIDELLQSLVLQKYGQAFEVVVVEDGSTVPCKYIIDNYQEKLTISYYFKENSGPGDSRNFGMRKAQGDYFLILDSDCILPPEYLSEADKALELNYVDCFGGPDKALDSFSDIQKAINFSMTSFLTTGGIRGGSEKIDKFQPRSFNMGLSKKAFEASQGFGNIHPGEDPDLSIRLWKMNFETKLFPKAYVYHKRRIDWSKFYKQVNKFGKARPILDSWYPEYSKLTFFFPTLFLLGFIASVLFLLLGISIFLALYGLYFLAIFIVSTLQNKSLKIGFFSLIAVATQFYGYGIGFLKSFWNIKLLKKKPQEVFPELFFKKINAIIMTKIIGLTGGIGSGKSSIAKHIESLGIPVYIADTEAKKILDTDTVIAQVVALFGNDILENGKIDRKKIAALVFQDPEKLKKYNNIIHPEVYLHFKNWVKQHNDSPLVVKEAAILFESGSYKDCDKIILVTAPKEYRIERVMKRDAVTREAVEQRMTHQWDDERKKALSDYVIENIDLEKAKQSAEYIITLLRNQ